MACTVLGIAATNTSVYALRGDGAVFVLLHRGDRDPATGDTAKAPRWLPCPAVPGTEAATEQEG